LSAVVPLAVDVNVPVARSMASVVGTTLPDDGRSGDTKYAKLLAITLSVYSPLTPLSRSYTEKPISDDEGSTKAVDAAAHP
jgi:hypothetical protein